MTTIEPFISAVILVSDEPERLQRFYSGVFEVQFETESHGQLPTHYVGMFGDVRLIIHSDSTYPSTSTRQGAVHFAVAVSSIEELVTKLHENQITILNHARETFGQRVEFLDADGNFVQAVELAGP